jgi:hypothetical protein
LLLSRRTKSKSRTTLERLFLLSLRIEITFLLQYNYEMSKEKQRVRKQKQRPRQASVTDAQVREVDQVLADRPEKFERCDKGGKSNPNGEFWKLRDPLNCN